ncbi:unnamed protein product, partial [marine sediment metagenome]
MLMPTAVAAAATSESCWSVTILSDQNRRNPAAT